MLIKLYTFFGFTGIASLLLWAAALVMLVNYLRHARRFEYFVRAFAVAAVGLMLAMLNSRFVAAIEVDRSYEMQKEFEQREAELNYIKDRAAKVKFAEDDKYDSMDLAGIASKESLSIYENAMRAKEKSYLYKQGKTETQSGKDSAGKPDLLAAIESAESPGPARTGTKQLPLRDVNLANLWAEVNLWLAFSAFICALIAMALDYLWRFNSLSGIQLPLPLAGRWIDHLVHKKHSAFMEASRPEAARSLLDFSVRKGETFIYFGPSDPFPDQGSLAKLHLPLKLIRDEFFRIVRPQPAAMQPAGQAGRARIFLERIQRGAASVVSGAGDRLRRMALAAAALAARAIRALLALPVLRVAAGHISQAVGRHSGLKSFLADAGGGTIRMMPVQKLSFSAATPPFSDSFVFETAWFGKGCFIFAGEAMAESMLRSLLRFLEFRARPRATAGRTLNIVWHLNAQPPAPMVRELAALAGETNARFVLISNRGLPAECGGVFEEVLRGSAPDEEGISFFARFLKVCRPYSSRLKSSLDRARETMRKRRTARKARKDAKAAALREERESARRSAQAAQSAASSAPKALPPPAKQPAAGAKQVPAAASPVTTPKPAPKTVPPGQGIVQPKTPQPQPARTAPAVSARKPEPVFHDSLPVPPALKPAQPPKVAAAAKVLVRKPAVHVAPPDARPAPAKPLPGRVVAPAAKAAVVVPAPLPPAPPVKPEPPEIVLKIPGEFASAPKLSIPLPAPREPAPVIAPVRQEPPPAPAFPKPAAIPAMPPPAAPAKTQSAAAVKPIVLASVPGKPVGQPAPAPSVKPPPAAQAKPPTAAPAPRPATPSMKAPAAPPAPKPAVPVPKPSPIPRPAVAPAVKSTPAVRTERPVARPLPPLAATIQPVPIAKPAMTTTTPKPAPAVKPAAPVVKSPPKAAAKPVVAAPAVKPPAATPSVKPAPAAVVKPKPAAPAPRPVVAPAPPRTMPSIKPAATAAPRAAPVLKPVPIPKPAEPAPAGKAEIKISDVDHANRVFKFFCPTCGQKLSAEFDWHGKSATCPRCATKIIIPKVFS